VATEVLAPPPPPASGAAASAKATGSLTRRASLNAAASLLDYFAKAGVGLVVTPILVSGLGRSLFGVWEMLSQLTGYMSPADGRPSEALRLIIAQRQHSPDDAAKRRSVGAALAVWALMLPLIAAVGAVIAIWLAPVLTKASPELRGTVQLTSALLALTFLMAGLADVPESVLSGMNLGYRRMGLQAGLNVLGGALAVAAIWQGLGLVGLGGAQVIRASATGLVFWAIARAVVRWLGVERPTWAEVKSLFGMSIWLSVGEMIAKFLLASDLLVLGAVVAPAVVTTYVLTGYAARMMTGIHLFTTGAAMPGIGGLIGAGKAGRAGQARRELQLLTWLFVTVGGATVLLWNHAFLGHWVGTANFAGPWVNLLVVLSSVQTCFIRTDAYVIDAALRPKQRVMYAGAAVIITLVATITLTRQFGMVGLCVGMLLGRSVQSIAYPLLSHRAVGSEERSRLGRFLTLRLAAVTAAVFAAAATLGPRLVISHWAVLFLGVAASVPMLAGLVLFAGLPGSVRQGVVRRIRAILPLPARP
jgi:O-antigen/teichoic acid export membrane protein